MKRKNFYYFTVTFCFTLCLLGAVTGLIYADYNTRTATEGENPILVSSVYQNETLTIQTGEKVNRIFVSKEAKTAARFLHNALPAPLQIWELCALKISKIMA